MDLELVSLDEADLGHPVADVLALIALELKHLAVLGVFYDRSIASELLKMKKKNIFTNYLSPSRVARLTSVVAPQCGVHTRLLIKLQFRLDVHIYRPK